MHVDTDLLFAATQAAGFSIAWLAVVLSLIRQGHSEAGKWLTLFFLAIALSEVSATMEMLVEQAPLMLRDTLGVASLTVTFLIAPFFLFHLRSLTRPNWASANRTSVLAHLALPGLAALVGLGFLLIPGNLRQQMFQLAGFDALPLFVRGIAFSLMGLEFLIYIQWLVTVALVLREQMRHLNQLKQHFASTEGLERRWVTALALILGSFALICLTDFLLGVLGSHDPISRELDSTLVVFVLIVLASWSLRPSVGLEKASEILVSSQAPRPSKYERSALAPEHAGRIARKLRMAMQKDSIYRDPNLTLASLSKHIGVSTNYVSQTLNEHIGKSFFEFVSDWRVEEAMPLVQRNEQTVLAIAYEVGFNSRSAFYKAFKRQTGLTPSDYKAKTASASSLPA